MDYAYIIILSSFIYCFINATICAFWFPFCTGVVRKYRYFKEFFWFNTITILFVLSAQIIFLIYHCRLLFLLYKFFNYSSVACSEIPTAPFLTHQPVFILLSFYGITCLLIYHFTKSKYHLSSSAMKIMIAVSNLIACGIKYGITMLQD